ncbi:hypothetical protein BC833DRAFT_587910 [Globomyces pollinis-pini]|nr:hypothetical protein BC833DRAFT_587910 [Globomyces pollinis-pini]
MTKVQELEKQLEHIMKELQALKTSGKFTSSDIEKFQNEIHSIDEKWQDGAIKEEDGSIQPGQADL